jgi:2-furoyl-CoA dehydrogenase FAD binding subunit
MKPRSFQYLRPTTLGQALEYLADYGDEARILAGGQSLIPMMNFRLLDSTVLIDIRHIDELKSIKKIGDYIEVGAGITQNQFLQWEGLARDLPLLACALPWVGHFQTRNRGTVCGSIAHADPSSELPLCLAMLRGSAVLRHKDGERVLEAQDFQLGMLSTARESHELISAVRFPIHATAKVAFHEVARRHGDFAIMGVGALKTAQGQLTLGIAGGLGAPKIAHMPFAQARQRSADLVAELDVHNDVHASADMRRDIAYNLIHKLVAEMDQ